jgi:helicase
MDLLMIPGVGRVRARKLYKSGFTTAAKLRNANQEELGKLVGPKTAGKILASLGVGGADGNYYTGNETTENPGEQTTFGNFH